MIIKIFKISTKEMYTFKNKFELYNFVKAIINRCPSYRSSIDCLAQHLPVDDYYRVK